MSDNLTWLNEVEAIDQDTVEQESQGYPWIQWVHGSPQMKALGGVPYTGGWFLPAEGVGLDDDATLEGWTRGTLTHPSGDETSGWFARDITIACIRSRRAWQVRSGDRTELYPWNQYDEAKAMGSPSGKLQVLAIVRGLDEPRPVVLTMRGTVSRAFSVSRQGESVLNAFTRMVMTPANDMVRKSGRKGRYPYRAFWLTVGPRRNADGTPIFETVGDGAASSKVTLPTALGLREKMSGQELGALFVGKETLDEATAMWRDAEEWANAWDARVEPLDVAGNGEEATYASEEEIPF
jgi:hypothetical protein